MEHNPYVLRPQGEQERRDPGAAGALLSGCRLAGRALQREALGSAGLRSTYLRVLEKEQRGRRLRSLGAAARERSVSAGMDHRRRVPEDLMGTILGEGSGASGEERALSESR